MNSSNDELKFALERLRLDLMATNTALIAIASAMPVEQHAAALKAMIQLSVLQEAFFDKSGNSAQIPQLQQAMQRLHSSLDGALKLRKAP